MRVHRLSRRDARRVAVRAQLLDATRPVRLLDLVGDLTLLQLDPTNAVAPSADLVCWSRLGSAYDPADLTAELDRRTLVELRGMIRTSDYLRLCRAEMAEWPGTGPLRPWQVAHRDWVLANDGCRRDILDRLRGSGPLTSRELPDTCAVPWTSSGWTNDRNVTRLLEFLALRGEVAIAGRRGRDRLWDLAENVYPDTPAVPADEARRLRDELRLQSLGIARARAPQSLVEPGDVSDAGEPAVVEGVRGTWRIDPALLDRPFTPRAALLSPFDRLVYDRKRAAEIFGYDYQVEIYKPAAKRRWGFYALPILYGDRLIGKLDATADRRSGVLRVDAIHCDVAVDRTVTAAVHEQIEDLAGWLALRTAFTGAP